MDYSKFDEIVDLDGLKADIEQAKENSGEYREVPHGEYEVEVAKMELGESKKGDPMVIVWFRILNGEFENSLLFMNQVITKGFQIHIVNELLRGLGTEKEVKFESYSQYGSLLMDIAEELDGMEYALKYGERKGFNTFKVLEIFDTD